MSDPRTPGNSSRNSPQGMAAGPGLPGGSGPRGPGFGPGGPLMKVEQAKDRQGTFRRLWSYLRAHRSGLVLVLGLVVLATGASLAGSYLIRPVINGFAAAGSRFASLGRLDLADPVAAAALAESRNGIVLMVLLSLAGSLAIWLYSRLMLRISQQTVGTLRQQLFDRVQRLPVRYFDTHPHGDLMSRMNNDMESIAQTVATGVSQFISSAISIAGTLGLMLLISWQLTLVSLVALPVITLTTRFITGRTRQTFKAQQEALGKLNGYLEETLSGQELVMLFGRQDQAMAEFEELNRAYRRQAVRAQFFSRITGPVNNLFGNLNYALSAGLGAWLAIARGFDLGGVATFLAYSQQFSRPVNEIANLANTIMSALAGAERVFEILDEADEYQTDGQLPCPRHTGSVRLEHVHFSYLPGKPVLQDVCLEAKAGQMVALVGPTGAGKTTIVNLLTRFYDLDSGAITIDGTPISALRKDELRRRIGLVLQDTQLFGGSIMDNIRFGRLEASDDQVHQAARLANADSFIRHLSQGYHTILQEGAANLSQGQRQLLTIARALLADPDILILDEATSSVDTRTEVHIQQAMRTLMRGRTSFVIAHRLSTIRDADLIAVLDQGRIVESGTHHQLLAAGGLYSSLVRIQDQGLEI